MWSSRLFWKLFASYAILNLVATITFAVMVSGWQKDQVIDQIKQRLHDSATLIRSDVAGRLTSGPSASLQAHVRHLSQEIDTRITVVAITGRVLADSNQPTVAEVDAMENHRSRVEFVQAIAHGVGSSRRDSPTLGESMLYVALRIDSDGQPVGLVRTALPMTAVLEEVASVQQLIWLVGTIASIAVAGVTWFLAASVVRPVQTLTKAAEAITAGEYRQSVFFSTRDELDALAKSFNRMSKQLNFRETQLLESSRRLGTVLEGMVEGVIALDDREKVVLANSAAGRLLNFDPSTSEGRSFFDVVRNRAIHDRLRLRDSDESQHLEIEMGDSEDRVFRVTATLLSSEPSTRCILVLHDVTELRRLESLRQEFVTNVSHELKTPLSSIRAYAETLLNGAIDDDQNNRRFVAEIDDQAERLHELILDLLSIARLESGQQTFDIRAVNLAAVVQTCVTNRHVAAVSRNLSLTGVGDPGRLLVSADEEGLRQILDNLIDNAIKYTPENGSVAVTWRAEDSFAVIEVRDTGQGIRPEFLPRLFERFFRVDKARSRELGGTGLGLSIVKHLAQSFGGFVDVASEVGIGTVFTVRLPLAPVTK